VGSACCYDGSTYDDTKNICVPNAVYAQDHPTTTDTTGTTEGFEGLGKYANTQAKPTYYNNNIMPMNSSF
jgi:hypothetical protein